MRAKIDDEDSEGWRPTARREAWDEEEWPNMSMSSTVKIPLSFARCKEKIFLCLREYFLSASREGNLLTRFPVLRASTRSTMLTLTSLRTLRHCLIVLGMGYPAQRLHDTATATPPDAPSKFGNDDQYEGGWPGMVRGRIYDWLESPEMNAETVDVASLRERGKSLSWQKRGGETCYGGCVRDS